MRQDTQRDSNREDDPSRGRSLSTVKTSGPDRERTWLSGAALGGGSGRRPGSRLPSAGVWTYGQTAATRPETAAPGCGVVRGEEGTSFRLSWRGDGRQRGQRDRKRYGTRSVPLLSSCADGPSALRSGGPWLPPDPSAWTAAPGSGSAGRSAPGSDDSGPETQPVPVPVPGPHHE